MIRVSTGNSRRRRSFSALIIAPLGVFAGAARCAEPRRYGGDERQIEKSLVQESFVAVRGNSFFRDSSSDKVSLVFVGQGGNEDAKWFSLRKRGTRCLLTC